MCPFDEPYVLALFVWVTPLSIKVRSQAAGFWRSVKAYPEEEGQDHEEAGLEDRVLCVQVEEPGAHQEDQALWARRREEEEGTDDPVLAVLAWTCLKRGLFQSWWGCEDGEGGFSPPWLGHWGGREVDCRLQSGSSVKGLGPLRKVHLAAAIGCWNVLWFHIFWLLSSTISLKHFTLVIVFFSFL